VVSIMSAWEIAKLVQKGKLAFSVSCREWIDGAVRADGVVMHPLDPDICVESTELPGAFHGDPADQLIVATARLLGAPVVTADQKIRTYPHVPTIW
jgi:PIN domain nuclease of toxin-antitoxin system